MLQPFFDFIERFATDFSWKRLIIVISFVIFATTVFFFYESLTATNQLSKYERSVKIVEKLESLKLDSNKSKKVIDNIYKGLVQITEPTTNPVSFTSKIPLEFKQGLLAASPWLLFCLFFIPGYVKGKKENASVVIGTLVLSLMMGVGGYLIPTEWERWITFGLVPVGVNILIFMFLIWLGKNSN